MGNRLEGKVAIVTGSTMGIGAAIVRRFVAEGARVVVNSHRDDEPAARFRAELAAIPGADTMFALADVADRDAVRALARAVLERHGRIDVLVNNAGMNVFADPLELSQDDWQRCLSVDLEGAWNATRAVLPAMLEQGAGSIVNIASVHGHKVIPGCFPYPVAKHALVGMTRALGVEYAARGIRVNSISPGLIMTEGIRAWLDSHPDPDAERRRQEALLPCRRIGEPDEVACTALFLASDEARYINATDILIDGGRSQMYHE
jgi:NAD(P)-dependent dehydrogenase (short-subunit alcohol dehydrogenase family)